MLLFKRDYLRDLKNKPQEALDTMKEHNKFIYNVLCFLTYIRIVFNECGQNHCFTRASAIAYGLLFTLIPLVASAAFFMAGLVDVRPHQVETFFALLLPFAPSTVLQYLSTFFVNAQNLKGIGVIVLVLVTMGLFGSMEEALNTVWKVPKPRSFFSRLRTFTMVSVYSPILLIASFQIRNSLWLEKGSNYFFPLDILPFLLTVLAFVSILWYLPNTKVKFRSALIGGLVAGILFEAERLGYGEYVRLQMQTQTIYGAFGILPLFLISLFLVSLFLIFGAELAYVYQNFRPLLRSQRKWDRRVGDYRTYIALRMVIDSVHAFMGRFLPPSLSYFMKKYDLTDVQALGILRWLVHEGFLHNVTPNDSYVPSKDYSNVRIQEVLDAIEDQNRRIPHAPDDYTKVCLTTLFEGMRNRPMGNFSDLTFLELITELEKGSTYQKSSLVYN